MPKEKKVRGRPFKKGHKMSVGHGRPVIPAEVKEIRKLNNEKLAVIMDKYAHKSLNELKLIETMENVPAFELLIVKVLIQAIEKGDPVRFNLLFDRMCGKVKDKLEVETSPYATIFGIINGPGSTGTD